MDGLTNLFADIPDDLPEELIQTLLSTPWSGSLRRRSVGDRSNFSGFWNMQTFAGKTATSKAIRPQAASREVAGTSSRSPRATSNTPLRRTKARWYGRYGGMIFM